MSSSFATQESKKAQLLVDCYITPIGHFPCQIYVGCGSLTGTIVCTAIFQGQTYQAYAKLNPTDTVCPFICYKPFP